MSGARVFVDTNIVVRDALVVSSAERCECVTLLSEDLQHGRRFGPVTVVKPFDERP